MEVVEKKEHYDITDLLSYDAEYNLLLSERSSGKSYQIKKVFISDFINNNIKFIYLRRHVTELKEYMVNSYFADPNIPYRKWTKDRYDGIMCFRGNLYFYEMKDDKQVRGPLCGKYFALSIATNYKSMSLTDYRNIVFEEFVAEKRGYTYLIDECTILQDLISTIARKNKVHVYMVGNTINSMCPYFRYWSLKNIPKQKRGTIDIYNMEYSDGTVKIAVEACEETARKGRMFFGKAAEKINSGIWTSREYPKLPYEYKKCRVLYTTIWEWGELGYKAEVLRYESHIFLYVRPCDINKQYTLKRMRFISDRFNEVLSKFRWHTPYFIPVGKADGVVRSLIQLGHVCYSDNLSGEEFNNIYEIYNRKGGIT